MGLQRVGHDWVTISFMYYGTQIISQKVVLYIPKITSLKRNAWPSVSNAADRVNKMKIKNWPLILAKWHHLTKPFHSVAGLISVGNKDNREEVKQQAYTVHWGLLLLRNSRANGWRLNDEGHVGVKEEVESVSRSVMSDSLQLHGL